EHSILASRLVDRPIRPLFPKGYRNDVQVIITVLSVDQENDADILGLIGPSAALAISDIPFAGPVGAVNVGSLNGTTAMNPSVSQMKDSLLDLVVAGTSDAVVMVEAGARELPEATMVEAIRQGHETIKRLVQLQQELVVKAGKSKGTFTPREPDAALAKMGADFVQPRLEKAGTAKTKGEREAEMDAIEADLMAALAERYPDRGKEIAGFFEKEMKKYVRKQILEKGIRPDGRTTTEIRPIWCETGLLPRAHGSAIFTRGQTQVLSIVTLGSPGEEQMLDGLGSEESKRYIHHY